MNLSTDQTCQSIYNCYILTHVSEVIFPSEVNVDYQISTQSIISKWQSMYALWECWEWALFPENTVHVISCRHSQVLPVSICAFHVCYIESRGSKPAASAQGSALPAFGSASAAVSGKEIPPHTAQGPNPAPVAAARPQTQGERAAEAERKVCGSCPEANS